MYPEYNYCKIHTTNYKSCLISVNYLITRFVYIENFLKTTITSLYANVLRKQCELERTQLSQKLSLASYSLDEFAYQDT